MTTAILQPRAQPAIGPEDWKAISHAEPVARARLLLADDHDMLLDAFRRLLEPEFAVVSGVTDGEALVSAALSLKPDVVVCDISMPRLSGLHAIRRLREELPKTRFVILTMHRDPELASEALRIGASAYVLKSSPSRELVLAIRTALSGREYVCPTLSLHADALDSADAYEPSKLSPRGREVLKLLAGGRTMKETAARLGITPRTVAFHKYRMMQQLSLRSSAELVQFAARRRIV
jgi:DNA-binding NarL/FixJ family response regulator